MMLHNRQIQVLENLDQHETLQAERAARMDENWKVRLLPKASISINI